MVISSRLRSMRPSRMLAFTLISYHLENVRESCAFKKGVSLIEINRANPLSRLFSTLLERVRGIGSCRFTTSKVSLWQILLQNDFERVVTQLLFKEAMDDARLIHVARLLDSIVAPSSSFGWTVETSSGSTSPKIRQQNGLRVK